MNKKNDNILMYKDEQINKSIQERKKEEDLKKQQELRQEINNEKLRIKQSRLSIFSIPVYLTVCMALMIATIGVSFYFMNYTYIVSSVIGLIFIGYMSKRINFKYDETLNVLMWNLILALEDFLEFKIRKDVVIKCGKLLMPCFILFIINLLFIKSNLTIFGISLFLFMLTLIVPFIKKDFMKISGKINIVSLIALIGFILKTLIYSFIAKDLYLDFANIIICVLFTFMNFYLLKLKVEEPRD